MVEADKYPKEVGDMWFGKALPISNMPGRYIDLSSGELSDQYVQERMALRPPVLVKMPNGEVFSVDASVSGKSSGWAVTGEPPNITMSPSINLVGRYHGWLQNGVISDDCEGRTFPRAGS
jgi:hypothetical protein